MEWNLLVDAVIWRRKNWAKVRPWVTPVALASGKTVPKDTFRIVLDARVPPWWHLGAQGKEPATQIHARYYVTNITDENMLVVGCKLKPQGTDQTYDLRHSVDQMLDDGERSPTTLVMAHGFIQPTEAMERGEPLIYGGHISADGLLGDLSSFQLLFGLRT